MMLLSETEVSIYFLYCTCKVSMRLILTHSVYCMYMYVCHRKFNLSKYILLITGLWIEAFESAVTMRGGA